eukprot:TRINITY_DN18901_c0_g1_i2.p1 TRINITY_DN18901_c0_g1~~TRINITY_DN18901_c0_g1_i2.p1  ORF type:complete len:463 (-),score=30.82 TRINITY_DN18901_c0_g1_i2:32-1300(-)
MAVQDGNDLQSSESTLAGFFEKFAVAIVFTIFVVFRALDRVFMYRVCKYMGDPRYNLILMNLFWPISVQCIIVALLLGNIMVKRCQGNFGYSFDFFLPGYSGASPTGPVPLYKMALFSLGDQLSVAASAAPAAFVSLPMQSIMSNFCVVATVGIASMWIGTQFKQAHYIGCALIIVSVVVGIADRLESNDCEPDGLSKGLCLRSYKDASGDYALLSTGSMMFWSFLYVFSTVPTAVSNVYKQWVLQGLDLDVLYACWWGGNFQVVWGLLLFWVNWLPLPGQPTLLPSESFQLIGDTWQCFIGNVPHASDKSCAEEGGPAITWFIIYLCFNFSFTFCILWLTKRMSATWAQLATTLCFDLTNIFSQFRVLVGKSAKPMSLSQWLGTALASLALMTYNLEAESARDRSPSGCQLQSPAGDTPLI